jgi:hypothetical protein
MLNRSPDIQVDTFRGREERIEMLRKRLHGRHLKPSFLTLTGTDGEIRGNGLVFVQDRLPDSDRDQLEDALAGLEHLEDTFIPFGVIADSSSLVEALEAGSAILLLDIVTTDVVVAERASFSYLGGSFRELELRRRSRAD